MSAGLVPWEAVTEGLSQASPSSWCHQTSSVSLGLETPRSDRCPVFLGFLPVSQCPWCLCPLLLLENTSHWVGAALIQDDLILRSLAHYIFKDLVSTQSQSEVPGAHEFWRDLTEPPAERSRAFPGVRLVLRHHQASPLQLPRTLRVPAEVSAGPACAGWERGTEVEGTQDMRVASRLINYDIKRAVQAKQQSVNNHSWSDRPLCLNPSAADLTKR